MIRSPSAQQQHSVSSIKPRSYMHLIALIKAESWAAPICMASLHAENNNSTLQHNHRNAAVSGYNFMLHYHHVNESVNKPAIRYIIAYSPSMKHVNKASRVMSKRALMPEALKWQQSHHGQSY